MFVTRLGHAALLVETEKSRLLIDPGGLSSDWHRLTGLDAVFITHQHHDHVDPPHVVELMKANPGARVVVEEAVVEMLAPHPVDTAVVGDVLGLGDLNVELVGGQHALIHESIPRIGNVGLVVTQTGGPRLFHPGDSYATTPRGVDVLALPLSAPWARVGHTIDFANAVRPVRMFPIHDAILSDKGRPVYVRMCTGQADEGITFDDPAPGEKVEY